MKSKAFQIIELVCSEYNITLEQMMEKTRKRYIVSARQMAMLLISDHCPLLTPQEIGYLFNKDRCTVIHGTKTACNDIEKDIDMKFIYDKIKRKLLQIR